MNAISKIAGLSALLLIGVFAAHHQSGVVAATIIQDCGCSSSGCTDQGCSGCAKSRRAGCGKCGGKKRGCRKCPKCQMEYCELEAKQTESQESCFKTEQKIICIPRVRMPWQKCCPPTVSKTRTINVLKKHSYKCPSCEYEWKLHEPEVPENNENAQAPLDDPGQVPAMPVSDTPQYESVPPAPPFEQSLGNAPPAPKTYDPSVPAGSR